MEQERFGRFTYLKLPWAPKGDGGKRLPSREISGVRPPTETRDISVTFFLTRIQILHFTIFSK